MFHFRLDIFTFKFAARAFHYQLVDILRTVHFPEMWRTLLGLDFILSHIFRTFKDMGFPFIRRACLKSGIDYDVIDYVYLVTD